MNDRRTAFLPRVDAADGRFPNALRVGDTVYAASEVLGAVPQPAAGSIQEQTHEAFSQFVAMLEAVGARMSDLVKLHTYYVYDGPPDRATVYWEGMTQVRLQYFADPGPAGTALRVKGSPVHERLITIDGVASTVHARDRIMPAHAWDWSIPTPLSQGWRIGSTLYAGGQISADRQGRSVAPDDVVAQTINTMEFLRHVLMEGGAGFEDVVTLKIAYQDRGDQRVARGVLDRILGVVQPMFTPGQCALTCLGVDLLYEGLVLEIDAIAELDAANRERRAATAGDPSFVAPGFASAVRAGDRVYVGAIAVTEESSLAAQLAACLSRLERTLTAQDTTLDALVKLNVFYCTADASEANDYALVQSSLDRLLPRPGPVVTVVRVAGLPESAQRVQIDAVAMLDAQ